MTLRLQTLRPAFAPALARLANNKKIWDNVRDRMPYPYTQQHAATFISNVSCYDNAFVRAIVLPGDIFAGTVGLHLQEDPYTGSAELAYWLGEPFWGTGLASLAVKQMIHLGFEYISLRRIFARVYSFNQASARVLEKNGFRCETVARAAVLKNDQIWDELTFGLLRDDHLPHASCARPSSSYQCLERNCVPAQCRN